MAPTSASALPAGRTVAKTLSDAAIRGLRDGETRTDGALPVGHGRLMIRCTKVRGSLRKAWFFRCRAGDSPIKMHLGDYLFSTTLGKKPIHSTNLSGSVAEVAKATCTGDNRYRPADIRRSVETRLQALGVSRDERAQLLSHGRTAGVQGKHYERYDYLPEKRAALALWERHLKSVLEASAASVSAPR